MEINEVTIFKLAFFTICIIVITIVVLKLNAFDISFNNKYHCKTLLSRPDVVTSYHDTSCAEGFYPNFGEFKDVPKDQYCCVYYQGEK